MKIAVVTTFPESHFEVCAKDMLASFMKFWPQDIKMYIQLDEQLEMTFMDLNNKIISVTGEERVFIAGKWDEPQKKFLERYKDHKPKTYRDDIVRFSHKIFALEKCADAIKNEMDYLIWLDADVITKSEITYEWLKEVLPADDEVVSLLRRKGLHSECGFVAYNLKCGGYELLQKMVNEYLSDDLTIRYSQGLTDCHVIDYCLQDKKFKDLCPDYVFGKSDINVWPTTKLAEKMEHRKGNRKYEAKGMVKKINVPDGVVDANNLNIKTRNCLDGDKIKANVSANLSQIRAWATICRPSDIKTELVFSDKSLAIDGHEYVSITTKHSREKEIILCSAGPSLVNHIDEIKKLQSDGAKVVCVKHAINTLKLHGVKPWAVVLLDPRAHVEEFIKNPDQDVVYFVASMCDPSVVRTLNENKCKVIGYHAFVNAGEIDLMIPSDLPVSGGSGTATRSIGLFSDMFGYKTFHLFGYDLCHYQKPDMNENNPDGNPKYMEISIGTKTHKNKNISRTFWTEGQLLAQSNELKTLCKDRTEIDIRIYGDGLAGWLYRHHNLNKAYLKAYNEGLEAKRKGTPTLDEYIATVTRGSELSRGI